VVTDGLFQLATVSTAHRWLTNPTVPVIVAAGRLHYQKDYPTLLRAFKKVTTNMPARLIIIGEGSARATLQKQINEMALSENVDMPGFVSNPYSFMGQATLYVLSSIYEGSPTVLVEALACGTPVVATDCPSGPRDILAGGKYGTLVSMQDPDQLAHAIISCLSSEKLVPKKESWFPYTIDESVAAYSALLWGDCSPKVESYIA